MLINIKNIIKALLIHELIKNVYNKSESSKKMYAESEQTPAIPLIAEIDGLLRQNQGQFIDCIGCVKLCMDFSNDSIDPSVYDSTHNTGIGDIETAAKVVERITKSHISSEKIVWEGNVPAGHYVESTGGEVIVTGIVCEGATVKSKYGLTIQGGVAEDKSTLIAQNGVITLKLTGDDVVIHSEKLFIKLESVGNRAKITAGMYLKVDQNIGEHCVITTTDWVSAKMIGAFSTINANGGVNAEVILAHTKIFAPNGKVDAKQVGEKVYIRAGYDIRVTEFTDPSADMETVANANGMLNGHAYGVISGRCSPWPSKTIKPIVYHQPHLEGALLSKEIDLSLYKPTPFTSGKISNVMSKDGAPRDITVCLYGFLENVARANLGVSIGDDPQRGEKYLTISWNNKTQNIFLGDLPLTCTLNFYEGEFFPKAPISNKGLTTPSALPAPPAAESKSTLTKPSQGNNSGIASENAVVLHRETQIQSPLVKEHVPLQRPYATSSTTSGSTESKSEQRVSASVSSTVRTSQVVTSSATSVPASSVAASFFNKKIEADRRFTRSNEPGILWVAKSYSLIEDEVLRGYGLQENQWLRKRENYENIVIIRDLQNPGSSYTPT